MSTITRETEIDHELAIINTIEQIRVDIASKRAEERAQVARLRQAAALSDARMRDEHQETYDNALARYEPLAAERAEAEARRASIEAAWNAGDDSVSADEATALDVAIKRLTGLEKAAQRALVDARRELEPWLADYHLSYLAGDIIATVTDAPILHHNRAQDAPEIVPSIILSQTKPTIGYGTIDASGEVNVTLVGEPVIDWRRVKEAFEDAGCEVTVTDSKIVFHSAAWPLPRLTAPSGQAVTRLADLLLEAWQAQVEVAISPAEEERLARVGIRVNPSSVWTDDIALSKLLSRDFGYDDGRATGTIRIALAAERHTGTYRHEDIEHSARDLVKTFANQIVGDLTPAGEVTDLTLVSVEKGDGSIWDRAVKYGQTGHPIYLPTIEVEVRVSYMYEPASSVSIAND